MPDNDLPLPVIPVPDVEPVPVIPTPPVTPDPIPVDDRTRLQISLQAGYQKNPDTHAQAIQLADPEGLTPQAVADNLDVAKVGKFLHTNDPATLLKRHPTLAKWLSDHDNAAIAHDDIPLLKTATLALRSATEKRGPGITLPPGFVYDESGDIMHLLGPGFAEHIGEPIDLLHYLQYQQDQLGFEDVDRQLEAERLKERFGSTIGANLSTGFATSAAATSQALGSVVNTVLPGAYRGLSDLQTTSDEMQGAAERLTADMILGHPTLSRIAGGVQRGAGGLVADAPLMLLGGPVAKGTQSLLALKRVDTAIKTAGSVTRFITEQALKRGTIAAATNVPLALKSAINVGRERGAAEGALNLLINTAVPGAFGGAFGLHGVQRVLAPAEDRAEAAVAADGVRGLAARMLKESGFQGTQEAVTELANALQDRITDPTALEPGKLGERLATAGILGGMASLAFSLPEQVQSMYVRDVQASRAAVEFHHGLTVAVESLQESKAAERAPERVQQLLNQSVGEGVPHLYFEQSKWDAFWQAEGQDPAQVAKAGGAEKSYLEAKATGSEFQIPTGEAVRLMAGSENAGKLTADAKQAPGARTATEAGGLITGAPDEIKQLAQKSQDEALTETAEERQPSAQKVFDDIYAQTIAAGRKPTEAKQSAQVMSRIFTTMAERLTKNGIQTDPFELFQKQRIRVQRGEGVPRPQGTVMKQGQPAMARDASHLTPEAQSYLKGLPAEASARLQSTIEHLAIHPDPMGEVGNLQMVEAITRPKALAQGKDVPRGTFLPSRLNEEGENLITMMKDADRSTFIHESAHFLLEFMHELGSQEQVPEGLKSDLATIRKWVGAKDGETITEDQHEQFARGFERYLMEGKAPSVALKGAFKRFSAWLTKIYKQVTNLGVELSPDVRDVFARLLATDEEIRVAEGREQADALFATAKDAGKTDEEFAAYQKILQKAHDESVSTLQTELMDAMREKETAAYSAEETRTRTEMQKTVDAIPVYRALSALQDGIVPDGFELGQGETLKISKDALIAGYGEEILAHLPGPRDGGAEKANAGRHVYTTENGLSLQDAADLYGFKTGDDLVRALVSAEDRTGAVERLTAAAMAEKHPDPMTDGTLEAKATEAIYTEKRSEVLHDELTALKKLDKQMRPVIRERERAAAENERLKAEAKGEKQDAEAKLKTDAEKIAKALERGIAEQAIAPIGVYRDAARTQIERTVVRDLSPHLYLAASRKAAKEAAAAYAKQDYLKAGEAKQRELMSNELYRAALDMRTRTSKAHTFLGKFKRANIRKALVKAGGLEWTVSKPDGTTAVFDNEPEAQAEASKNPGSEWGRTNGYLNQIDALLERFDLGSGSQASMAHMESLARWITRQEEDGNTIAIPDSLREQAYRKPWKLLPAQQFLDLKESVANIAHLAKSKNDISALIEKATKDQLVADLTAVADANANPPRQKNATATFADEVRAFFNRTLASLTKMSFDLREMDGFKEGGIWWDAIMRPLNHAEAHEVALRSENSKQLLAARRAWGKDLGPKNFSSPYAPKFDAVLNTKISLMDRIMVLLNYGTANNRERLLNGHEWSPEQAQHVIDSLDQKDIAYAKAIWKVIGSHKSDLIAQSQRLAGVSPRMEEGLPVQTRFGEIAGQYFPIKYDGDASIRKNERVFTTDKNGQFGGMSTRHGFLDERVTTTGRRILLDERVITQHLSEVAHRLSHEDAVQAIGKLMRDERVYDAVVKNFGVERFRTMRDTILEVANGGNRVADEKAISYLRRGITLYRMGYNLLNSLLNFTGITQSMTRIHPKYFLRGIQRLLPGDYEKTKQQIEWARGKSKLLQTRTLTAVREYREALDRQPLKVLANPIEKYAYVFQQWTQTVADHLVWNAAYEQAVEQFPGNEQKAIDVADQQVIDTQSSGSAKDLPGVQRGGEMKKLLTMFYYWSSSRFNLTAEAIKGAPPTVAGKAVMVGRLMMLYTVPIVLESMMIGAIRRWRGGKDDDEESTAAWLAKEHLAQFLGTMPVLREFQSAITDKPYSGPAAVGPIVEANQLVRQMMNAVESGDPSKIKATLIEEIIGIGFHLPIGPLIRAQKGYDYAEKHDINPVGPMLFGPPPRK